MIKVVHGMNEDIDTDKEFKVFVNKKQIWNHNKKLMDFGLKNNDMVAI